MSIINDKEYKKGEISANTAEGQEVLRKFGWCQTSLVNKMLENGMASYDEIENLYLDEENEEPQEIFEWWQIDTWLAKHLQRNNEPILNTDYGIYWGRTCRGIKMKVEIKRWDNNKIIISGEYTSLKDCVKKNRDKLSGADLSNADLSNADLSNADLSRAYLSGADLSNADLSNAYLSRAYLTNADLSRAKLSGATLTGTYLSRAYLSGADLSNADLSNADLSRANLTNADLIDIKGYSESHDIWIELIKRQHIKTFTEKEWSIIGQIWTHRLCWDSIKKRFGKKAMTIFKKLSKTGYNEYELKYKEEFN